MSQEIPGRTKIVTGKTNSIYSINSASDRLINNNPIMPDIPFHQDLLLTNPKQQPIKQNIQEINPNINLDFEENSPFRKVSCWRHSKGWISHFSEPKRISFCPSKQTSTKS